ncbi:MAG TPA: hypothetical protein VNU24_02880, partial [Solirubrobacteraceae bacterium]|nr:hypothetical protein [Solirubrobacteraceae bacterium]
RAQPPDGPERTGNGGQEKRVDEPDAPAQGRQARSVDTRRQAADGGSVPARHERGSARAPDSVEKPSRGERAARLAAYASAPELDEVALLASARQLQAQSSPQTQAQAQAGRQGRLPIGRQPQLPQGKLSESAAGDPPDRALRTRDPGTANLGETRMRTSREIMDDAREVAAGRKRQLGLGPSSTEDLDP